MLRDRGLMAVLGLALLTLVLQAFGHAPLTSDDAVTGWVAHQVLQGRFPVWMGGNRHYSALKGYLDAPFVGLFGPSDWALLASSWILAGLDVVLVMFAVWLLLGRRPALAAGLVTISWPAPLMFWMLSGCAQSVFVCLWLALPPVVLMAWRRPEWTLRAGAGLGFLGGLAFWTAPQSALVFPPLAAAYLLGTWGQAPLGRRLGVILAGFVLGCAPLWVDGLAHGFYQDADSYLGQGPAHSAAENWRFYLTSIPWSLFGNWLSLGAVGLSLALCGWNLLTRWRPRVWPPQQPGDRDALFCWCLVPGTALLWLAAIGFTTAGGLRVAVERHALPVYILMPWVVGLAWGSRNRALVAVTVLICGPSLADTVTLAARSSQRGLELRQRQQVREVVRRRGVTYLMGDYWDVGYQTFWFGSDLAAMTLSPDLCLPVNQQLPQVARPGPGLLLVPRGSATEKALEAGRWLEGMEEIDNPGGLRLLAIPGSPVAGRPGFYLAALGEYGRHAQALVEGQEDALEIGAGLRGEHYTWDEQGRKIFHARLPGMVVFGPHLTLPRGRYGVRFRLSAGASAQGSLDVALNSGRQVPWRQEFSLAPGQSVDLEGAFELARDTWTETRVFLDSLQGAGELTVDSVRLSRKR